MRRAIIVTVSRADCPRLEALARNRNPTQKHMWAQIVRLSADGLDTNQFMRRAGKSKTGVWRW